MIALQQRIAAEGLTQRAAAKLFGVTQPRISDFMRGNINLFRAPAGQPESLQINLVMPAKAGTHNPGGEELVCAGALSFAGGDLGSRLRGNDTVLI